MISLPVKKVRGEGREVLICYFGQGLGPHLGEGAYWRKYKFYINLI